jgi:hypothetical protein
VQIRRQSDDTTDVPILRGLQASRRLEGEESRIFRKVSSIMSAKGLSIMPVNAAPVTID